MDERLPPLPVAPPTPKTPIAADRSPAPALALWSLSSRLLVFVELASCFCTSDAALASCCPVDASGEVSAAKKNLPHLITQSINIEWSVFVMQKWMEVGFFSLLDMRVAFRMPTYCSSLTRPCRRQE